MVAEILPSKLSGKLNVVSSKSLIHRYLILSSVADKPTRLNFINRSSDVMATVNALINMGAKITCDEKGCTVIPIEFKDVAVKKITIDAKESASTLRFLMPFAGSLFKSVEFTGEKSLKNRQVISEYLFDRLKLSSKTLPTTSQIKLVGNEHFVRADITSQDLSGLLMSLPVLGGGKIKVQGKTVSESYVEMTKSVLADFGVRVNDVSDGYEVKKDKIISRGEYNIGGDWSNASYFILLNKLGNKIEIENLDSDFQGDKKITEYLDGIFSGDCTMDLSSCPDLMPTLAVGACFTKNVITLTGVERLKYKESNRIESVVKNLSVLGVKTKTEENAVKIYGDGKVLGGEKINSFFDHRIAMAFSVLGLCSERGITIENAECVSKSYPEFFNEIEKLKGKVYVH